MPTKKTFDGFDNHSCINARLNHENLTINEYFPECKSQMDEPLNIPSQETLKEELRMISKKMKRLEKAKKNEENGMNEILQQLIDLKIEKENVVSNKEEEI